MNCTTGRGTCKISKIVQFILESDLSIETVKEEMQQLESELESVSYDLDPYWLDLRDLRREKGWDL